MTRFGPVLLVALLIPLTVAAEDKQEKKEDKKDEKVTTFTSKDGQFSIGLPGKPTEQTKKLSTAAGDVNIHLFGIDLQNRAYLVTYNDYPDGAVGDKAQATLDSVIEGNANGVKGKVVKNEKITYGKKAHPGRDVRIEFGGEKDKKVYRARVYLVGNRLYQAVALGTDEFTRSKEVDEYFKSFVIEK